jgi:hypothetical protein
MSTRSSPCCCTDTLRQAMQGRRTVHHSTWDWDEHGVGVLGDRCFLARRRWREHAILALRSCFLGVQHRGLVVASHQRAVRASPAT